MVKEPDKLYCRSILRLILKLKTEKLRFIKDINAAVNSFNQTNTKINKKRTEIINDWQDNEKKFTDEHMPHYK
jgi:hypothetical protein